MAELLELGAKLSATMAETGATALPSLPMEVNTLKLSHRPSITSWRAELRFLKRSMSKAGAKGAGAPEFPSLLAPAEQAARLGSEWPRTGENRCRSCPTCLAGGCRKQGLAVLCPGCQGKKRCVLLVCTKTYLEAPSVAGSVALVTSEILAEKISRLHRSGEEYRAAFDQFTDRLCELGLECGDTLTRLQVALEQDLLNRR